MILRFGEFEIDEEQSTLRCGGAVVAIQPKAFDVLHYLVRERGRVVHKRELLDRLWPDAVVGEHSVVRAVSAARGALGDNSDPHRFIRSFARRGYRFVAELADESVVRERPSFPYERREVFLGRDALLTALRDELESAFAGSTRVVVLEGEAGIGKTRTATETEGVARALGAQVYTGWCQENEPSGPFQPWLRILSALSESESWAQTRRTHPGAAEDVSALLRGRLVGGTPGAELSPGEVRLRLFEAVAAVLRAAAAHAPLLLVIDDLHAADSSSLRLIEFLARELAGAPLGLLVTLRSEEVSLRHPVVATLGELTRRSHTQRFTLDGLGREDVGRCIAAWTRREPEPELVDEVFRRSEGNPFFVRELARWLSPAEAARGNGSRRAADLPPSVRDVIRHRLQRRSAACLDVLSFAAVIGHDFDLQVLLRSGGTASENVLGALEEAVAARLVDESEKDPGRWRFAHTLIRETLLAEKSALWVSCAHRTIAESLLALDGDGNTRLIERAHHACRGADAGNADEAVACALRAAGHALALTAFEEAARLYRSALRALALAPGDTSLRKIDLQLDLGRALTLAGDVAKADEAFIEAEALAESAGDARRRVRAILGLMGSLPSIAPPEPARIAMLERAIGQLGAEDRGLRVTALSRLGVALRAAGNSARGIEKVETALAEARELADPRVLASVLVLRTTVALPSESSALRLARVEEALKMLTACASPRVELECRLQRASALLESGDTAALRCEFETYAHSAERIGHPTALWYAAVQRALLHALGGELAEAERCATLAFAAGRRAGHPDAGVYFAIQLTQLRYFQGRLAEVEDSLRRALTRTPALAGLRAALALVLVETGRTKEARRELDGLARAGFAALPRDAGWLSNLSLLALVSAALGHGSHTGDLEAQLAPYADRNVCAFVVASNGSAEHFLGILARAGGHRERALERLGKAVAANRKMGNAPWTAWSEQILAESLLEVGGASACERASALAACALSAAERMGMRPLAALARRTLREANYSPASQA